MPDLISHTCICFSASLQNRIRSSSQKYRQYQQDETIQREVFFHDTLPILLPGVEYNYQDEVNKALKDYSNNPCSSCLPLPLLPIVVEEKEADEEGVVKEHDKAEAESEI